MDIAELTAKYKETQELLKTEGRGAVEAFFKKVFEEHPEVVAFQWEQYAPYFNDGDPCEFSVHDLQVQLADPEAQKEASEEAEDVDEDDEDEEGDFDYIYGDKAGHLKPVEQEFRSIPEDLMELAFGESAKITVHREKGFEIDEASEHD